MSACSDCLYHRQKEEVQLIAGSMSSPGQVEAMLQENQLREQRREKEKERLRLSEDPEYEYEPEFQPWCQRYTLAFLQETDLRNLAKQGEIPPNWAKNLPSDESPILRKIEQTIKEHPGQFQALLEDLDRNFNFRCRSKMADKKDRFKFRFRRDPVSGEVRSIFALCAKLNDDGLCSAFTSKDHA